jgi:predicted AlkP superfamily pyrophosphatase or phosphodiesterase
MKNLIFTLIILATAIGCSNQSPTNEPKGEKVLLISFDGFRYDYLNKTETPNFDKLVVDGVISEGLIPIFPSKTFPNHYAIATGLYPENNGFVGNNMYDPEMDANFAIRDRDAVENPAWYQGEPIWNTVEKAGKNAGTMFWVGSEAPIQDIRPTFWKQYDESMGDSARIDSVISWMTLNNEKEVDLATLYFHFIDTQGHRFGPDSPELVSAVERADDLVGYLKKRMEESGLTDITNLMIVSDHGMASVSRERIVVLDDIIDPNDLEMIAFSPVIMANVKEGANLEEIYHSLKENEEHYKVYLKDEIPARYHLKNHPRIPELTIVADLGYTINTQEVFEARPGYPSGGAHGFDNMEKEMHALFVASGPDFKSGYKMKAFENIHIYEMITHLLNIEPVKTDGSVDSVSVMLN